MTYNFIQKKWQEKGEYKKLAKREIMIYKKYITMNKEVLICSLDNFIQIFL